MAELGGAHGDAAVAEESGAGSCCPVCLELTPEWVAAGPCGHREICVDCAVSMRFFGNDFRCCICRAFCPTVVITRGKGAAEAERFSRPSTAFGGVGRVGIYFWFHSGMCAYFDSQEQYDRVRKMCASKPPTPPPSRLPGACDPMFLRHWLLVAFVLVVFGGDDGPLYMASTLASATSAPDSGYPVLCIRIPRLEENHPPPRILN